MKKAVKKKQVKKDNFKRLNADFCGVCELRQLPKGTYFRTIDKNGRVSKETYTKDFYDRASKSFCAVKHSDVFGNGRLVKGKHKVTTDFIY